MRILVTTLLAIWLSACASSLTPAEPAPEMMDEADTIILTLNEDPKEAYQNFENYLGEQGFTVLRSNEQPLTLETRYKQFDPTILRLFGSYSMKINATVKDSALFLSASLDSGTEVQNSGSKRSPMRSGWDKIVEIAQQFPHQEMYFSRN